MTDATDTAEPVEPAEPEPTASTVPEYPPVSPQVFRIRIVLGVVLAAIAIYAPFYFDETNNKLLSQALFLAVAAMGLNLLTGFNGQVSIGHGAFFGLGAFTTARLMADYNWTFEATIPAAAVLTGVFGLLVGFPALRVRGLYLALVTLGLAVLFPQIANKPFLKGDRSIALVQPKPAEFGSLLDFLDDDQWKYFVCLAAVVVLFLAAWNLTRVRPGRAMIATREQELAAATVGVNLAATKVQTFAISAAYAGIAGSLSVMVNGLASATNPATYFQLSIEFLVALVIGGTATILGPLVGALMVVALRRNTEDLIADKPVLSPAIFGSALILIVFVLPDGVVGGIRRLFARMGQRRSSYEVATDPT